MGLDARTRYTKMRIRTCFIELLKTQPITKITVKRICEMAEINRATFYKYYRDPFDLLEQIENELLEDFHETVHIQIGDLNPDNISRFLISLFQFISEKKDDFITLGSENGDRQFIPRIFNICYQSAVLLIKKYFPRLTSSQQKQLFFFYAHGLGGMLLCWIKDGMKESPEEMAAFMEILIRNSASHF